MHVHHAVIGYTKIVLVNLKTRSEYQSFLKYYSTKQWDCPICRSQQLPFILLNEEDFYLTILDLSNRPTYINKENFKQVFMQLKESDFLQ